MHLSLIGRKTQKNLIRSRLRLRKFSNGLRATVLSIFPSSPSPTLPVYARGRIPFWIWITISMERDSRVSPGSCSLPNCCWRLRPTGAASHREVWDKRIRRGLTTCGIKSRSCSFVRTIKCSTFLPSWWPTPVRLWTIRPFTENLSKF